MKKQFQFEEFPVYQFREIQIAAEGFITYFPHVKIKLFL